MKIQPGDTVYFLGIGGIGMSALARYYKGVGCRICGYDKTRTPLTRKLEEEGMEIHYEENVDLLPDKIDMVIITPAIPKGHKEWMFFEEKNIAIFKRSEVLGMLSKSYDTLAIGGTHGKTSTSAMLTWILRDGGIDCTAFLGGIAANFGTNYLSGKSPWMVVEADEFDRSFLHLHPGVGAVLSMDPDHLDIYGRKDAVNKAYVEFLNRTETGGLLILPEESFSTLSDADRKLLLSKDRKVETFGIGTGDIRAESVKVKDGRYYFQYRSASEFADIELPMPGRHNVLNSLVAIRIARHAGVPLERIKQSMALFKGIKRRFEWIYQSAERVYIDDYAHHPTELASVIHAARELFPGKHLTGIFQPHLYSRTRDFMEGFARELAKLDRLILLDIYPAREEPIPGIDSGALLKKVQLPEKLLLSKARVLDWIDHNKIEILMTLGAGDIDQLVPEIKLLMQNG